MKHPGIAAIAILIHRGKVAMQHRDGNTPIYPNYWGLFGGAVKRGEMPDEAILREIQEELGLILPAVRYFGFFLERPCRLNQRTKIDVHVYSTNVTRFWSRPHLCEGSECAMFSWPEIQRMKRRVIPLTYEILKKYFRVARSLQIDRLHSLDVVVTDVGHRIRELPALKCRD